MTTECFNLVEQPWLPVALDDGFPNRDQRGQQPRVSLREAFEHGDKIVDLRCRPHERIALMRLLICIAQAALKGPMDENEWKSCRGFIREKVTEYWKHHARCFNLFGPAPRFLQAANLKPINEEARPITVEKLDLAAAAGANPTLFDNTGGTRREFSPADLAVMIVTYQVCSPGGLIGLARWNGTPTGKSKSSRHSLGSRKSGLHGFLLGATLRDTVHANLLSKKAHSESAKPTELWGEPVWEKQPQCPNDTVSVTSYLGRLVPYARSIWLLDDRCHVVLANGLDYKFYPEGLREPSITVVLQDGEESVLRGMVDKGLWRELHSIAVHGMRETTRGPTVMQNALLLPQDWRLWTGAVLTKKDSDAKIIDTVESVFQLPIALLEAAETAALSNPRQHPGANWVYRQGVLFADRWSKQLSRAVFAYRLRLADDFSKKQNAARGKKVKAQAATRYWTALEQKAEPVLLREIALNPRKYYDGKRPWLDFSPWGQEVFRAAKDAYDFACPHETPRQLRAYAAGLSVLFPEESGDAGEEKDDTSDDDSNET